LVDARLLEIGILPVDKWAIIFNIPAAESQIPPHLTWPTVVEYAVTPNKIETA
jgi:hypothetical protein